MSELRNTLKKIITAFVNFQTTPLDMWKLTPRNFLFRAPGSSWGIEVELNYHYNTIGFIVYDVEFYDGEWGTKLTHTDFIVETDKHVARILRKEEDLRFRLRDYHREYFFKYKKGGRFISRSGARSCCFPLHFCPQKSCQKRQN